MKKPVEPAQIQPKSQFLFHKNLPPQDFSIMTLSPCMESQTMRTSHPPSGKVWNSGKMDRAKLLNICCNNYFIGVVLFYENEALFAILISFKM